MLPWAIRSIAMPREHAQKGRADGPPCHSIMWNWTGLGMMIGMPFASRALRDLPRFLALAGLAYGRTFTMAQAEEIKSKTPTALFGFVDETDVIDKGVINPKYYFNSSGSPGSQTWEQKLQVNYGVTDQLEAGLAITYAPTFNTGGINDNRVTSIVAPLQYVLIQRMQNGTGVAWYSIPSFGWQSNGNLPSQHTWSFDNHLAIDHDFDGRYFLGFNLGYTAGNTYGGGRTDPSGTWYVNAGYTMKFDPNVYVGVQAQFSQQLNNYFSDAAGWATFLGASFTIPFSQSFTLAGTYMRQIAGGVNGVPSGDLNTRDFPLNKGRVVLSFYF